MMQTLARLLLYDHSDLGLHCLNWPFLAKYLDQTGECVCGQADLGLHLLQC